MVVGLIKPQSNEAHLGYGFISHQSNSHTFKRREKHEPKGREKK
jgi:hypothetical protein